MILEVGKVVRLVMTCDVFVVVGGVDRLLELSGDYVPRRIATANVIVTEIVTRQNEE